MYEAVRVLVFAVFHIFLRLRTYRETPFPEKGGVVLCCKHISVLDPIIIGALIPRKVRYMAKAEVFRTPVIRSLARYFGAFPVNRGKHDLAAMKTALTILKDGEVLGIFPEGTRIRSNELSEGKAGAVTMAYRTGCPIVPVGMYAKNHRIRLFSRVRVRIGKPLSAAELGVLTGSPEEVQEALKTLMTRLKELSEERYGN